MSVAQKMTRLYKDFSQKMRRNINTILACIGEDKIVKAILSGKQNVHFWPILRDQMCTFGLFWGAHLIPRIENQKCSCGQTYNCGSILI